jgi:hypothetical protein
VISITRMSGLGIAPYGGQIGGDTYSEPVRDLRFQEIEGVVLDRRRLPAKWEAVETEDTETIQGYGCIERTCLKSPVLQLHEQKNNERGDGVKITKTRG